MNFQPGFLRRRSGYRRLAHGLSQETGSGIWIVGKISVLLACWLAEASSAGSASAATKLSTVDLAAEIDRAIGAKHRAFSVIPAPRSSDAEFLRRVYLDLAGKIPPVSTVRRFLQDPSPNKRLHLVNQLIDSPAFIVNFANKWRDMLMPEANADAEVQSLLPGFEAWLRKKLTDRAHYDEIVSEILTMPLDGQAMNRQQLQRAVLPLAFYQAKQIAPENLAAATSRMFLGIRIECAQCHDHPFDHWERPGFWQFAAFFAGIEREGEQGVFSPVRELFDRRELAIPDTNDVVQAAYLGAVQPDWKPRQTGRQALAEWVTSPGNPYFARTAANRLWAHFFGIGIVDPVDDFGSTNAPSHPELLETLGNQLALHGYDLTYLMRAITASKTYQQTSVNTDESQVDPRLFARMAIKGMTTENLIASLSQATGVFQPTTTRRRNNNNAVDPVRDLQDVFSGMNETTTKTRTTILQALSLMNGPFTLQATDIQNSRTLAAVSDYPGMTVDQKVETLFLATLSRQPDTDELQRIVAYVERGGANRDSRRALADVFWVLLNSSEFMFNH